MKRRKLKLFIVCISIGLIFGLAINQTAAILVWEEDFENPPFDEWTLFGYDHGDWKEPYQLIDCPPIIANGIMTTNITQGKLACALHPSPVVYGTWDVDFYIPEDQESLLGIHFIVNGYGGGNLNLTGISYPEISSTMLSYVLYIKSGTEGEPWVKDYSISLVLWIGRVHREPLPTLWSIIAEHNFSFPLIGSHHLTISRESTHGEFEVFLDSNHIFRVINNEITTSEHFELVTFIGEVSFDNLTVSNTEPEPTTTTTTIPTATTTATSTTVGTTEDTTTTTPTTSETTGKHLGVIALLTVVSMYFIRRRKQKR